MLKNKSILITGGTGSFGKAVLDKFINSDISEIRIFSRDELKQDNMRKFYNNEKIKFYIGDVRNFDSISSAMINVDYVFHLAAQSRVQPSFENPKESVRVNVNGTLMLLEWAKKRNVKVIYAGSSSKHHEPSDSPYAMSKFLGEEIGAMLNYSGYYGMALDPAINKHAGKFATAPMPKGASDITHLAGWNIGIPSDAKNPNAAWAFHLLASLPTRMISTLRIVSF